VNTGAPPAADELFVADEPLSAAGPSGSVSDGASAGSWRVFMLGLVPVQPAPPPPPPPPPPTDTFSYDALDRLTSLTTAAGASASYAYSGDGLLASRSGTPYLWDRSRDPAPLLQAGSDRIVQGLGPLYVIHPDGTITLLARDGLGSVRAEVASSGAVTRSARYAAYGTVAASSGTASTPLGFAGEITDPSGLVYLRARWHDPSSGRLLTGDPGSPSAARPNSLNRFAYANGNPLLVTDPTGRVPGDPDDVCILRGCGGGGVSGGGAGAGGAGTSGTIGSSTTAATGRGGAGPVLQGQAGVRAIQADLEAQGWSFQGREVTVVTPVGRVRVDLVMRDQAGELHYIEVKNGMNAELARNQNRNFPYLANGDAIAVGANAEKAGFVIGERIPLGTLEIVYTVP
jgi:RHS repeat-associated protein